MRIDIRFAKQIARKPYKITKWIAN